MTDPRIEGSLRYVQARSSLAMSKLRWHLGYNLPRTAQRWPILEILNDPGHRCMTKDHFTKNPTVSPSPSPPPKEGAELR